MRYLLRVLVLGLVAMWAAGASAQPWYVRGDFNGWGNSTPMTDLGGGHFTYSVTGLGTGEATEFKVADDPDSWGGESYPGSNSKTLANAAGEITFHFYQGAIADGWEPSGYSRVGYDDPQQFGWEVIGSMNGWGGGWDLADLGNGLHRGVFSVTTDNYVFKFRRQGDWDISIGQDFGNAAGDINQSLNSGLYAFELDLPGGRWRVTAVPEPASAGLCGLAFLTVVGFVRRRK